MQVLRVNLCLTIILKLVYSWPTFYLYTKIAPDGDFLINGSISGSSFEVSKNTILYVHGFQSSSFDSYAVEFRKHLIQHTDANIIMVEWLEGADPSRAVPKSILELPDYLIRYFSSAQNTKIVGNGISGFINSNLINPATIHCIGSSLGSHACGFAGKKLSNLKRITGLDPAGPGFKGRPEKERLDKSDAQFVDCIMTSDFFGISDPICHKNFYPNGGMKQPKCPQDVSIEDHGFDFCSHMRSFYYFDESLDPACDFLSTQCENYDLFRNGTCKCTADCSPMGLFADSNLQTGQFYLDTNQEPPYCKKTQIRTYKIIS